MRRLLRQLKQLADLNADFLRIAGQRDRFEDFLDPLPLGVVHLLEFVGVGKVRRGSLGDRLGLLQAHFQALRAVL